MGLAYGEERRPEVGGAERWLTWHVSLPLPVWQAGAGQRQRAAALAKAADEEAEAIWHSAWSELRLARERAVQALEAERAAVAVLPRVEKALGDVEAAFQAGQLGLSDFPVKRDGLYAAQVQALMAPRERARLVSAFQGLWGSAS